MSHNSSPQNRVVVDARPRSDRGLIASEMVLGMSAFQHTLEQANRLRRGDEPILVVTDQKEPVPIPGLQELLSADQIELETSVPSSNAFILRTDRLYETGRLRKARRRGADPESAVLWRLDDPRSIENAGEELIRRLSYQPLGRYWAFPIARRIASSLAATPVRPNALTLSAWLLMMAASAVVAFIPGTCKSQSLSAMLLAIALVLDTADGRLARLQGSASPFGKWLDNILDELADLVLHASIAWGAFVATGKPGWLLVGMLYASGKYLFVVQSAASEILEQSQAESDAPRVSVGSDFRARNQRIFSDGFRGIVRALGHADLRWHGWIVLAAIGRLDIALIAYAVYFPFRAGASSLVRGLKHVKA